MSRLEAVAGRAEAVRALSRRAAEIREAFTASTFSELVASAPSAQLGEVLTLDRDEVAVETEETYRPAGIKSFGKGLFARPPITGADTKYKKFNRLREGRFVYSRLKAWEGAVAVVGRELDGFVVSQEYPTFDINGKRLDAGYLAWICDWAGFWQMLADATRGLGARRERVPVARLLSTRIPLPPLTEQRRLGAIGAALGEAGRKATEVDRLLDALVPSAIGAALIGEL